MKSLRLVSMLLVLVLLLDNLVWAQRRGPRFRSRAAVPETAAALVPPETSLFIEIQNPAELRDGLEHSPAISKVLGAAGEAEHERAGSFLRSLGLGHLSRERLAQTRVAYALIDATNPQQRAQALLAIAPDSATALAAKDALEQWFSQSISPIEKSGEGAGSDALKKLTSRDGHTYVSGYEGPVSFVGDPGLIDAVMQRLKGSNQPSLSQSKEFADARVRLAAKQQIFAFFSRGTVSEIVQQFLQSLDPEAASVGRTTVDFVSLDGVDAVALGASYGPNGATERFQIYRNAQSDSILNVVFDATNGSLEVFTDATKDATTAVEYHFDYTKLFDRLFELFGPLLAVQAGAESAADALANYEKEFGFKIRDELLPTLGDGVAIVLEPRTGPAAHDEESVMDAVRERGVLLLPVRDRAKFAAAFEKVRLYLNRTKDGTPPVLKPTAEYRSVEIIHERGAAMAYLGSRFAIARETNLKQLIDACATGSTLSKAPEVARIFGGSALNTAGAIYLDSTHGATSLRDFASRVTADPTDRIDASQLSDRPFLLVKLTRNESGLAGTAESPLGLLGALLNTMKPVPQARSGDAASIPR